MDIQIIISLRQKLWVQHLCTRKQNLKIVIQSKKSREPVQMKSADSLFLNFGFITLDRSCYKKFANICKFMISLYCEKGRNRK